MMDGCSLFKEQQDYTCSHNEEIYNFIQNELPKVELHAHLNGCIPSDLLHTLAQERNVTLSSKFYTNNSNHHNNRSLQDCFDMFRELPNVINDLTAISQITMAALEQFAYNHSTIYLELRTTPKRLLYHYLRDDEATTTEKCTKREYMETIINTVRQFEMADQTRYENECLNRSMHNNDADVVVDSLLPRLPMTCRILISVDRSQSIIEATENIDLAIALYQELSKDEETYVVGVDLGGNPQQQDFCMFESLFQKARDVGLKVTIHCAEIECPSSASCHHDVDGSSSSADVIHSKEYKEIQRILQFRPDRIGHGVLLPKDLLLHLEELQIPVESCPTSNVLTLEMFHHDHTHHDRSTNTRIDSNGINTASVQTGRNNGNTVTTTRMQTIIQGLQQQHYTIQHWITNKYPIIICTDDPGIFDTNLTNELYIVYQAFHWESSFSLLDLIQLIENSINYAFCSESIRIKIKVQLQQRLRVVRERGVIKK